ncbi:TlpA family protein disulfide reductase [Micromonospora peucetia]|uniref:AhpC/TSA family protein n=1 Tax=Micromonospora peucetia TaxID=47871 RepID=A0A1C6VVG2_9ACTN|nr:redoxin domain-containing protein [Micromonospora peucetia]SCL69880.1 AhpC/TSA family protein [Micromonospora peucetia]
MAVLTAVVLVFAALCLVNLLLTWAIVKRLRVHTEMLNGLNGSASLGVGQEVTDFAVATVDGERIDRDSLAGKTLVGFFTPTCEACKEKLPKFAQFARRHGRDRTMAVVVGTAERVTAQVATLREVARVVVEERNDGPVCSAFQVMAFPAVLSVGPDDNGRVVVIDDRVRLDRQPASA